MSIPWKEVIKKQEYQGLSEQDKTTAKVQYFNEVVRPKVPQARQQIVERYFYADTSRIESEQQKVGFWKGFVKPTAKAIPRIGGALVGAAAMFPVSGVAGGAKLITSGLKEAGKTVEEIGGLPMRLIKTPEEEQALNVILKPIEWIRTAAKFYGDLVYKKWKNPELAASVATAVESAAFLGIPGLKAKLTKSIKAGKITETKRIVKEVHKERLRVLQEEPKRFEELAKKETKLRELESFEIQKKSVQESAEVFAKEIRKATSKEGVLKALEAQKAEQVVQPRDTEIFLRKAHKAITKPKLPEAVTKEIKPKVIPKPKEGVTLSMLGTEHVYQAIVKTTPKIKEYGRYILDKIDVEAPFKRIGSPGTGRAIKGMFSARVMHEEFGLGFAKKIAKDLNFDKAKMSDIVLLAEQAKPRFPDASLRNPTRQVQQYFKEYQKEYAKYGVKIDFKKRIISEIEDLITQAEKPSDVIALRQALVAAKKIEFVHIPSAMWFTDYIGKDPAGGRSFLNLLVKQERKNLRIQDLIDRKLIKKEDINIVDVIASYARRAGKDLSLLEIVKHAEKEGLAVTGKKVGFVDAPYTAPILKGKSLHPVLADLIFDMTRRNVGKMNPFEKVMAITKMTQFYNFLFLPMYDVVQAMMIGTINPLRPLKTAKYIKQGVRDSWLKTPEYWEAQRNYISSKPFNNPLTSYERMIENAKMSTTGMIGKRALESITPKGIIKAKVIQNIYNTSWYLAWELDKTIRQISYRALTDKGYTPKEAASLAALAHSDYASVPAKTRKVLNHLFFTPTFKITMGKFYTQMMKNAYKGAKEIPLDTVRQILGKEKLSKMTPIQKRLAMGVVATVTINQAWEFFMQTQGFKRDEWGRRYVKKVQTPEGEKEIVVTWSTPANMFLKYISRAKAVLKPGVQKPLVRFFEMNKWEFHPIWRTGYEMANNSTGLGDQIYNEFDTGLVMGKKLSVYAVKKLIALVGLMDKAETEKEARELFIKESGQLLELATRPFTFKYVRSPEEKRKAYQIRKIIKQFREQIWKDLRKNDIDPKRYKQFAKEINKVG